MLFWLLKQAAVEHPGRVAVIHGEAQLTYAALAQRAETAARRLLERGINAGDSLALALPTGFAFLEVMIAAAGLGATLVPLLPRGDQALIRKLLLLNRVAGVVADPRLAAPFTRVIASGRLSRRADDKAPFVVTPEALAAPGGDAGAPLFGAAPPTEAVGLRYALTRRGGLLRRVPRTYGQLLDEGHLLARELALTGDDVLFCGAPLHHELGMRTMAGWLCAKATLVLDTPATADGAPPPEETWGALEAAAVSTMVLAPYALQRLARRPQATRSARLRAALLAASALSAADAEAWSRCASSTLRLHYGPAETGPIATGLSSGGAATAIGRPHDGVEVVIVDAHGEPVPAGSTGEIAVRSRLVMAGYEQQALVTRRSFLRGHFLTGDLGHLDAEGRLAVTGRLFSELRVRGQPVDPLEIETVLARHPKVRDCVVARTETRGSDEPKLEVHVVTTAACHEDELRQHCTQQLPFSLVPQVFRFVDGLPMSAHGRVLRPQEGR